VFDRSKPLPGGGHLEQADGTAWMAFYCGTMLAMALELAHEDPAYEDIASKFFEHFVAHRRRDEHAGRHRACGTRPTASTTTSCIQSNGGFPVNFLLIEALERYHHFYGETFLIEFPTGSGRRINLAAAAQALGERLTRLFLPDANGRRPAMGDSLPWVRGPGGCDHLLFHEFFHGETGQGLGASHQTGWTALVAHLLVNRNRDRGL
jgi:hypothetical protein